MNSDSTQTTKAIQTLSGLYAITHHDHVSQEQMLHEVEAAIRGGARTLQYRDKHSNPQQKQQRALALQTLCKRLQVSFLINDDVELCAAIHADGVHLGTEDAHISDARNQLGQSAIIGATCHDSLTLALSAQEQGADYIALGRFFPSPSKAHAKPAQLDCINQIKNNCHLPIVAIGGITLDNAPRLIELGIDAIAVINDLYQQNSIQQHAQKLSELFNY